MPLYLFARHCLYQQDNKMNTMYVESTAVECFKAINEAFKDDGNAFTLISHVIHVHKLKT